MIFEVYSEVKKKLINPGPAISVLAITELSRFNESIISCAMALGFFLRIFVRSIAALLDKSPCSIDLGISKDIGISFS